MSEAYAYEATVPAFPLGQPEDGRKRYGMTRDMAFVYRWLVRNRSHDAPYTINFRQLGQAMATNESAVHGQVVGLVERGWLDRDDAGYRFVHPVMRFKEPRNA